MQPIRVLVVDDAAVLRRLVAMALTTAGGIDVVGTAADGRAALEEVERLAPDLVVMDLEMPELDGVGAVQELRRRGWRTPVVMVSTPTDDGAEATLRALAAGATDFFPKPTRAASPAEAVARVRDGLVPLVRALVPREEPPRPPVPETTTSGSVHAGRPAVVAPVPPPAPLLPLAPEHASAPAAPAQTTPAQATPARTAPTQTAPTRTAPTQTGSTQTAPTQTGSTQTGPAPASPSPAVAPTPVPAARQAVPSPRSVPAPPARPASPAVLGRPVARAAQPAARPAVRPPAAPAAPTAAPRGRAGTPHVLALGSSTGGPEALARVVASLPADLPVPVVITQHMPPVFTRQLAVRLDRLGPLEVREAEDGDDLRPGRVLLAPGDRHLQLRRGGSDVTAVLSHGAPVNFCRPAVDVMLRSCVDVYGAGVLAVVLTGMGSDGRDGCADVRRAGGSVLVQDAATSVVWGMPGAVAGAGLADAVLPLEAVAGAVGAACRRGVAAVAGGAR